MKLFIAGRPAQARSAAPGGGETPALQGGRFTAGGKSIPWLKLAYMKILPTLHKAEVTILEQLVVKHHVRI